MSGSVLTAPIPARWGYFQRCKNASIYAAVRLCAAAWRALPQYLSERVARALGKLAHACATTQRVRAVAQLQQAFPLAPQAACERWARQMFTHLAMCIAELADVTARLNAGDVIFAPGSREVLDAALAQKKGVVLVAGHIGNWELMAQALVCQGYPLCTIAKPLYDPRLTRWIHQERARHGMEVIWRGDSGSARRMLEVFRRGQMLGLLIDQDTTRDTAFVPFFGRPAATPLGAATLALRFKAPVVVIWSHRHHDPIAEKNRHRITCRRLCEAESLSIDGGLRGAENAAVLTARMSRALEEAIREVPGQWVWLHRRWRRQPHVPPDVAAE